MSSTATDTLLDGNRDIPLHRLPNELLAEIFRAGHRQFGSSEWMRKVAIFLATITSVCRLWRRIALNDPLLWCTIYYSDVYDSSERRNHLLRKSQNRIHTYLLRAKSSDLSIHLNFLGGHVERIRDIIFPHLSHCFSLNLTFFSSSQALAWFPLPMGLHRLIKLSCKVGAYSWRKAIQPPVMFSGTDHTYKLQELMLRTDGMPIHQTLLGGISAGSLIEFRVGQGSLDWDDVMTFLCQCRSLRMLKLGIRPPPHATIPSFVLPNLICLQVTSLEFPNAIHTPKLQSLVLLGGMGKDDPLSHTPLPFWPNLHTLRFLHVDPSRSDFIALLCAHPTVKVLMIGLQNTYDEFLGDFRQLLLDSSPRILPNKTNGPCVVVPSAGVGIAREGKGEAKEEKRHRKQAEKEDERNQAETEDSPNTFLPSLRLLTLFGLSWRWRDDSSKFMASAVKRRPCLRFERDGEIYDGAEVDEAEMEIIDEFPVDGDTWSK